MVGREDRTEQRRVAVQTVQPGADRQIALIAANDGIAERNSGGLRLARDREVLEPGAQPRSRQAQHQASGRSEEHTSELQSLMRISYAVFCLKKKNQTQQINV